MGLRSGFRSPLKAHRGRMKSAPLAGKCSGVGNGNINAQYQKINNRQSNIGMGLKSGFQSPQVGTEISMYYTKR
jgi:hypothetical protein